MAKIINETSSDINSKDDCIHYDPPYGQYDKPTLIQILSRKDELISHKTSEITRLQAELQTVKTDNVNLRDELTKLKPEPHNADASNLPKDSLNTETEYGDRPMPDWCASTVDESALSIGDIVRATAEAELKNMEPEYGDAGRTADGGWKGHQNGETNPDYVFDSSSGFYYHPSTGYYWDPNSGLFYDYTSGVYYKYNENSGDYEVHSQVDSQDQIIAGEGDQKSKHRISSLNKSAYSKTVRALKSKESSEKRKRRKMRRKSSKQVVSSGTVNREDDDKGVKGPEAKAQDSQELIIASGDESSGSLATDESELVSDPESGEIVSSSSSSDVEVIEEEMPLQSERMTEYVDVYTSEEQLFGEAMVDQYPPCIRVIVQESEKLPAGTLFIITCAGGTLGRDTTKKHCVQIPDIGVSKSHASIEYDYDDACYKVADLGSQNGTMVNGHKLCQIPSENNNKHCLTHGDVLELGLSTKLLLHIHKGHDTCEECEPGQIQAKLKALNTVKNAHVVLSSQEKKQQQKKELKKIKKKYGLQNSYFENEGAVVSNPNYEDKAHLRRKLVGSDNDHATPHSRPASVHCPIEPSNKGHALLAKMGWKEGEGLGKAGAGITEPINVELRVNQSSGLGSSSGHSLSLDHVHDSSKAKRWSQARQRFHKLQNTSSTTNYDSFSSVQDSTNDSSSSSVRGQDSSAAQEVIIPTNTNDNNVVVRNISTSDSIINTDNKTLLLTPSSSSLIPSSSSSLTPSSSKSLLDTSSSNVVTRAKPQMKWHKGDTETLSGSHQSHGNKDS